MRVNLHSSVTQRKIATAEAFQFVELALMRAIQRSGNFGLYSAR
jgi:hypothetical protein